MASSTSLTLEADCTTRWPFPATDANQHPRTLNILVAEDNPLNSRILETRLTKKGHKVRLVLDGQGCIDAFENSPASFDIILMDIQVSPTVPENLHFCFVLFLQAEDMRS